MAPAKTRGNVPKQAGKITPFRTSKTLDKMPKEPVVKQGKKQKQPADSESKITKFVTNETVKPVLNNTLKPVLNKTTKQTVVNQGKKQMKPAQCEVNEPEPKLTRMGEISELFGIMSERVDALAPYFDNWQIACDYLSMLTPDERSELDPTIITNWMVSFVALMDEINWIKRGIIKYPWQKQRVDVVYDFNKDMDEDDLDDMVCGSTLLTTNRLYASMMDMEMEVNNSVKYCCSFHCQN